MLLTIAKWNNGFTKTKTDLIKRVWLFYTGGIFCYHMHTKQRKVIWNRKGRERHAGRSLQDVMRWFETMVTNEYIRDVKKGILKPFNKRLFQQSSHDHIIRGEKDYQKIWEYIDTNPLKWELDCFYNSETEQWKSLLRLLSLRTLRIIFRSFFSL